MTTVWQIQSHKSVMRSHDSLVDLQICRTSTEALNVDTPFIRLYVEGLQGTSLAHEFYRVDVLVPAVVPGTRVTFGVFVGHRRSQGTKFRVSYIETILYSKLTQRQLGM